MAKISREEVGNVAKLANLRIDDSEIDYYERELSKVLSFFQQLDQFTSDFDEGFRADLTGASTPERSDEPKKSLGPEQALSNAHAVRGSSFVVPRILE